MFRRFAVQAVEPGIGDEACIDEPREQGPADNDGREHADHKAQGQVDGKAFDRAAAHDDEDDGGDNPCQLQAAIIPSAWAAPIL